MMLILWIRIRNTAFLSHNLFSLPRREPRRVVSYCGRCGSGQGLTCGSSVSQFTFKNYIYFDIFKPLSHASPIQKMVKFFRKKIQKSYHYQIDKKKLKLCKYCIYVNEKVESRYFDRRQFKMNL